jgi:hypothetical protein
MADHETNHHSDGTDQETDSASENNGDVDADADAEIERQDQIITELQKSLEAEQRISKGLRENIQQLDDRIGTLGDGLIDHLGSCRDLQSALAEEKARMPAAETDSKTARTKVRFEGGPYGTADSGRLREGEVYSLEELMAETIVLTDERREIEERRIAELDLVQPASPEPAEMVAPDAPPPEQGEDNRTTGSGLGTLVITLQGRHQIKYPLHEGEITIGRSNQNDIQINSEFVSRVHARIIMDAAGAVIEDVSSKNGVLLDSDPVKRHSFRDGNVVVLGTTLISFLASTEGAS